MRVTHSAMHSVGENGEPYNYGTLPHELGHYFAARSVGIRVEKFYVGMNLFGLGINSSSLVSVSNT